MLLVQLKVSNFKQVSGLKDSPILPVAVDNGKCRETKSSRLRWRVQFRDGTQTMVLENRKARHWWQWQQRELPTYCSPLAPLSVRYLYHWYCQGCISAYPFAIVPYGAVYGFHVWQESSKL